MTDPEGDKGNYYGAVDSKGIAEGPGCLRYDHGGLFVGRFHNGALTTGAYYRSDLSLRYTMDDGDWTKSPEESLSMKYQAEACQQFAQPYHFADTSHSDIEDLKHAYDWVKPSFTRAAGSVTTTTSSGEADAKLAHLTAIASKSAGHLRHGHHHHKDASVSATPTTTTEFKDMAALVHDFSKHTKTTSTTTTTRSMTTTTRSTTTTTTTSPTDDEIETGMNPDPYDAFMKQEEGRSGSSNQGRSNAIEVQMEGGPEKEKVFVPQPNSAGDIV